MFVDCLTHLLDSTHTEVAAASKDSNTEPKKTVYFSLDRWVITKLRTVVMVKYPIYLHIYS